MILRTNLKLTGKSIFVVQIIAIDNIIRVCWSRPKQNYRNVMATSSPYNKQSQRLWAQFVTHYTLNGNQMWSKFVIRYIKRTFTIWTKRAGNDFFYFTRIPFDYPCKNCQITQRLSLFTENIVKRLLRPCVRVFPPIMRTKISFSLSFTVLICHF